jgi:hypothetical protein
VGQREMVTNGKFVELRKINAHAQRAILLLNEEGRCTVRGHARLNQTPLQQISDLALHLFVVLRRHPIGTLRGGRHVRHSRDYVTTATFRW